MKEQFDKRLVEKIKDSFQNHEEPFNPQEWEKLSHAYLQPIRKRKFAYWPFLASGIAASLLLLLVFWPIGEDLEKNLKTLTDSITLEGKPFEAVELPPKKEPQNLALNQKADKLPVGEESGPAVSSDRQPVRPKREDIVPIDIDATSSRVPSISEISADAQKILEDINNHAANQRIGKTVIAKNHNNTETEKAQQYVDQWKSDGIGSASSEKENGNNVRLGLLVGPQSSSNPVAGMSLGAGVMSEFSFSNRLKLDVGVTYASHSMVPESSLPRESAVMNSPSPPTEMAQGLSNSPRFMGSNAELSFSGLDIPINLKYKVMDKEQSGLFLITGLSSMVYFNQGTTETMTVNSFFTANTTGDLEFQRSVQEFTHETGPDRTSDGVDLGRMLNLSVGYEYNLNNGTFLSIEPYYKLPLGDMTFANQQFSIGGVNLRMNFRLGK